MGTGSVAWQAVGVLIAQATLTAVFVLCLCRARKWLGLTPLAVAIGALQFFATLAQSVYVEVYPGTAVSPGSAVLFTGILFSVLVVYMRSDAVELRRLVYGLLATSVLTGLLAMLVGVQLSDPESLLRSELPLKVFASNLRIITSGTLLLFGDILFLVVLYEALSRLTHRFLFFRVWVSLACVLAIDTLIFVGLNFADDPGWGSIVRAAILGKCSAAVVYAASLVIYVRIFEGRGFSARHERWPMRDLFTPLSYRERYEALLRHAVRDGPTGLFNRTYFDENLAKELDRAERYEYPVSLLLIDVDNFKSVNDKHGHPAGDQVLRHLAGTLLHCSRKTDSCCRYGGDEFAVIVPHAAQEHAREFAERVRSELAEGWSKATPAFGFPPITITVGIATFPVDGKTAEDLVGTADRHLYRGKSNGQDRVLPEPAPAAPDPG